MKRYSKQRETILQILRSTKKHPTASYIYEQARQHIPNISLGTVYRNLAELALEGTILSFKTQDGCEHYDATETPHPHLCCGTCHGIVDVEIPFVKDFVAQSSAYVGLPIVGHHIVFYGQCAECQKASVQNKY